MPFRVHRSPDATDAAGVIPTTPDGAGLVDLTARPDPAAPAAPRIEDVAAAMLAQHGDQAAVPGEAGETPAPLAGDGAESAPSALVAELPPRTPDGEPVVITVQTQEELEAINRLRNGYARREQIAQEREEVAAERARIAEFTTRLQADPIGWIAENVPAEMQVLVAEAMVARLAGEHRERFDTLLVDEAERKMTLASLTEQRAAWRDQADRATAEERYNAALVTAIQSIVPDGVAQQDYDDFIGDGSRFLASLIRQGQHVRPEDVPALLAGHARRYGFTAATSAPTTATTSGSAPAPAAATPAVAAPKPAPKAVPLTPADMLRRAAAAAVVPAGAGAVPSTVSRPPSGMRIEDAASWWRQRAQAAS